jgi:hypothetical protein
MDIIYRMFIVGECILLRMYQISKYRQPSFATVLKRALLYTYITTCFWANSKPSSGVAAYRILKVSNLIKIV